MGKAFGICICRLVVWVFSMCPSYDFLLLLFDNNDDDDDDDDDSDDSDDDNYYCFFCYCCCSIYCKNVNVVVLSCSCHLPSCN